MRRGDERGVEYAPLYWKINYFFCGMTFVERLLHGWKVLRTSPADPLEITTSVLTALFCFMPLLLGRSFLKRLKGELEKELLSPRIYDICNWRIAQLLFIAYLAMLVFGMRS